MAIRIKRSSGNVAPSSLQSGQLAYVEGSTNGGTLFIGEISGEVREIAGRKFVDKLNGIESGAQVNTVTSVAGRTGAVVIDTGDLAGFSSAVDARIGAANLDDLNDVYIPTTPGSGQALIWNSVESRWEAAALPSGVTSFAQLNDTPNSFTGSASFFVRVNAAESALEFTQDIDDGTF